MLKTLDFIDASHMRPAFACHTPSHRTPKRRKRLISESFHGFSAGWFCFVYSQENQTALRAYFDRETELMNDFTTRVRYSLYAHDSREQNPIQKHLTIMERIKNENKM